MAHADFGNIEWLKQFCRRGQQPEQLIESRAQISRQMAITLESVVSQSQGLASAPLDRDLIVLNPEGENYVGLDNVGRRVWDLLADGGVVRDLCLQLTTEYHGDAQEITRDVLVFLNDLHADFLIQVKDPADVAAA